MRRSLFSAFLILSVACASAPQPEPAAALQQLIVQLTRDVDRDPSNAASIYALAELHAATKNYDESVRWLSRLDAIGWELGVADDTFAGVDEPRIRELAERLNARAPKVATARHAFTIPAQSHMVPEGIAWDPVDDVFYVSGIQTRNVLRVDRHGNAREFVTEAQDGMLSGLGLEIDRTRNLLWVVSSTTRSMRGYEDGPDQSMLAAYDLHSGRLVRKVAATPAWLNDLVVLGDGTVFATDTNRGNVMRLVPEGTAFEVWASGLMYPNGIESDGLMLYVADFRGIHRYDLSDRTATRLATEGYVNGIDGLSLHGDALIGIQNALGAPRVIRIDLSSGRVGVLESKNEQFEIPTTGAVAGDDYFFIANPGLRAAGKVGDPVMLKLPLR